MRFGIKLVPLREFTLVSYPLTSDEEEQIINDTKGLNHKQIINYALDAVRKQFSYNIYPSAESEASCVGFASMIKMPDDSLCCIDPTVNAIFGYNLRTVIKREI